MSVEARDGSEELSTPAVKCKRLHEEDSVSLQHIHLPSSQIHYQMSFQPSPRSSSEPLSHAHPLVHHPSLPLPDTPLGKYANFLQSCYTKQFTSTKWPHLDAMNYVKLAVISSENANRNELKKFRQQTIRGSIDDILEWKVPVHMKDILKPNYINRNNSQKKFKVTQLLIEGAPGMGKSTFAWEVCQKWGQHQLFNEYSLVVLIKFRDKKVQEAKSVPGLFYHPNAQLESEIRNGITVTGGHGLLLILEGFDEAPASKRAMDSIFVRVFKGQELTNATVILTTRPSASADLQKFCTSVNSRRIEIVGFGKEEIDEYIQCAFSDEQLRSDFKEYLSLYPDIHSMMYVPLNSAIVTHVYESCKSSGTVVPKTMTKLYSSLIRTLLLCYLNDKDKEEYKDTCTNINSFKDLPQPVYDQFCEICKVAFVGMMSAETEHIFQDLPSDFDSLGLMQSCPELYVDRGTSVSYNFLHLTLQEYLAAYHISQQSRDDQVAFMREHIESKKLEVVVRFLAGLTELGTELWDVVRGFATRSKPGDSNVVKLKIMHWLFESQDLSAITSVLGSDSVSFDPKWYPHLALQPFDWYVLAYYITHSSCKWELNLHGYKLEIFLRALRLQQDQCQLLSTSQIKKVWLQESDAVHLFSEICNRLSKHTDLLCHLEYLEISVSIIGSGGAVNLITSLTKFSTIKELRLHHTGIGFEDCKALSELLASSKCI